MTTHEHQGRRLALLIDAENVTDPSSIEEILRDVKKDGIVSVRRAYGDWGSQMPRWKTQLANHAIQPIQICSHAKGKNAADIALVIDAMDILHAGVVTSFCIVSSDNDFTRLAIRLRESGCLVRGFGGPQTPEHFGKACDSHRSMDMPKPESKKPEQAAGKSSGKKENPPQPRELKTEEQLRKNNKLMALLAKAIQSVSKNSDGWACLAAVGKEIHNQQSDFNPNTYGYANLSTLMMATGLFEKNPGNSGSGVYVREIALNSSR